MRVVAGYRALSSRRFSSSSSSVLLSFSSLYYPGSLRIFLLFFLVPRGKIRFPKGRRSSNFIFDLAAKYDNVCIVDLRKLEKLSIKEDKAALDLSFLRNCQSLIIIVIPSVN